MKRTSLTLIALLLCAGASQAQQSAKEAIEFAESIDFSDADLVADTLPTKYCYIIPGDGGAIHTIDGVDRGLQNAKTPFALAAGRHILIGEWFDAAGTMQWRSGPGSIRYEYEEGKCYRIGFDRRLNDIYVETVTDTVLLDRAQRALAAWKVYLGEQKLKRSEYLAFQRANPERLKELNGTWSGETKRAMTPYNMQCTVTGDRMAFESRSGKRVFVVEGWLYYNENTIVLVPDKAAANGKDVENFGIKSGVKDLKNTGQPKYVWYYTLVDGVLHIESNRKFQAKSLMWENDGAFRKTKQ